MKIEIDVPDGLLDEMDHIVEGFYHSREEYILEKIRQGLVIDESKIIEAMPKKCPDITWHFPGNPVYIVINACNFRCFHSI